MRTFLFALVAALLLSVMPNDAAAHARLVKSDPAARSELATAPTTLQLWFSERVEPRLARVTLVGGDDQEIEVPSPGVSADDPKQLTIDLPVLGPGTYRVRFDVVSTDGHRVKNEFAFTINAEN